MNRCIRCNINIKDNTEKCPLCNQILELDEVQLEDMYPDARSFNKRVRLFENIVLFISLVGAIVTLAVELMSEGFSGWSLIVLLSILYVNVVLRLAILGRSGYVFKTVWTFITALLVLGGIDYLTGHKGWSANYVYPASIIAMAVGVLVLMIVNYRNWQSYMMLQLFLIVLSLVALVLLLVGYITFPYLTVIALGCTVFLFLGTLIIGDTRAREELKRRFYI